MPPFQHARPNQHKGLKTATLRDLGKINVLCGPNNSGKSTILECLTDNSLHAFGRVLDRDATERMDRHTMRGFQWHNRDLEAEFPRALADAAAEHSIWFSDEAAAYLTTFNTLWQQRHPQSPLGEHQQKLQQAYQLEFNARPSVVLIPAKRKLDTSRGVNAFESIRPDGSGILNFLFAAKNQRQDSPQRGRYERILAAFEHISVSYELDLFIGPQGDTSPPPTNVELVFRRRGDAWIRADHCGMGLQDLLIILYFALAAPHDVVLIEEPENHLHPDLQRRLIAFLQERTEKQFFLSSHSSVFLNTQFADRVFTCQMSHDGVRVDSATSRAALLANLGYSIADNLVSDVVVLCEGPKDKPVIEEFFEKIGLLDRHNIKVWPLGGDIMDQLDLTVFQETHKLIALVDNDPGSRKIRDRFERICESLRIPMTRLERYSLENYFSVEAIRSVMKGQMPPHLTILAPMTKVSDQLGFEVKGNGGKIAKAMTLEDIKGTDFEAFLQQVAALAAQDHPRE